MDGTKISALNPATTPFGAADVFPMVQGGATLKATFSSLSREVGKTAYNPTADYWLKLVSYVGDINETFLIHGRGKDGHSVQCVVHVHTESALDSTYSKVEVINISGPASSIEHNSFRLVGTGVAGDTNELWVQAPSYTLSSLTIASLGKNDIANTSIAYHDQLAAVATAPTGAVVITSDWSGPWVAWTPILEGETTAGTGTYTTQVGRKRIVNGWCDFYLRIDWSAHSGTGFFRIAGLGEVNAAVAITGVTIGYDSNAVIYPMANIPNTSSFIRLYDGLSRQTVQSSGIIFISGRIPV